METLFYWVGQYAYTALFLLLMLGIAGLPLPDEILLTFSGYLVYKEDMLFIPTLVAAFLGSICGISLSYGLGRIFGLFLVNRYGRILRITEDNLNQVYAWFNRIGKWSLTFGYFFPGIRHLTAYVAGMSKVHPFVFALFAYTGGLFWALTFITLGYLLGEEWEIITKKIHRHFALSSGVVIALLLLYFLAQKRKRKEISEKE